MSSTIKELPTLDRPREKAVRYGLESLSDVELLTLLISSGYRGSNALQLSNDLLNEYKGLKNLSKVSTSELTKFKGIKEAKALNLKAMFELHTRLTKKEMEEEEDEATSEYLFNKYKSLLENTDQEHLYLVILNSKRRIIRELRLYIGTENNMLFSYKKIWAELLKNNGKYFYLIHNHPGKTCKPSKEDTIFTSELFLESNRMKIPMIDHLIIGNDGYHSFQEAKKTK